jgi:hypothetical protein
VAAPIPTVLDEKLTEVIPAKSHTTLDDVGGAQLKEKRKSKVPSSSFFLFAFCLRMCARPMTGGLRNIFS